MTPMTNTPWAPWFDGLLEAVWLVDPKSQRILMANQAAAVLQQVSTEMLKDAPVITLSASPEDQMFWRDVADGVSQGIHSETLLKRADGSTVLVERQVTLLEMDKNEPVFLVAMLDKSENQRAHQRLEELLAELRATLESTADGLLVCDLDGRIRAFNRLFSQLWELPQELHTCRDDQAVLAYLAHSVLDSDVYQNRLGTIQRAPLLEADDVIVLRNGRVLERITRPQLARGRPIGRVFAFRDITERAATEAQLQLAAKVFESSMDAIFVTDPAQRILTCNPMAQHLTQSEVSQLAGRPARELFFLPNQPDWHQAMDAKLRETGYWEGELWHRYAEGSTVTLQVSWVMLRNAQGTELNTVVFAKDLTERIIAQQRIEQLAYTDPLTGLPNRLMLTERVGYAIQLTERSQKGFAILFLDLDRFKAINDSLGHLFGDRVLIEVAARLKSCLRLTDTLCRLGGDEFVVHLHDADRDGAELTAQRILDTLAQPVRIDDMSFSLTCSVGIAMYPEDGKNLDELIQHADTAMYSVKERGKGHYRFYQSQMNTDLLDRVKMDHAMREGLKRQEFVLHFQPRVSLETGQMQACEALIRWKSPERGMVPPGAFIGVAEETGFIVMLGQWVLREAIRQAAEWAGAGTPCQVAVNVSALQFQQARFVEDVAACLREFDLPPALLELELTESILIHDEQESMQRLQALSGMGVELALDDFGTGYSSLSYLKRFPLHKLKIDRSFIINIHEHKSDAAIVSAIVQMGHALNLTVVAEGVEYAEQHDLLRSLGCDQFQGFLYSPAIPPEQFAEKLDVPLAGQTR